MASFTGLKNLGEKTLEYMMRHRPTPDLEMSAGLHDLDNLFPGIYGRHASDYKTYSSDPKVDIEAMEAINAVRGNPEAMVDIYRAVPKGVRDFNTGDWVTTSKAYAKGHGESALKGEYDLIKAKARAADISSPGDSIAEQGYWGMPVKGMITKGLLPLVGGGAIAAMSPREASAAEAKGLPADPTQYGGLMGYVARDGKPAGNPIQNELVAAAQNQGWGAPVSWGDVRHGLSYGSRAVLEGLGGLAEMGPNAIANAAIAPFTDYRFGNPGAAAADAMGLDRPWNNAERMVYGLNKGASETVPLVATGQALARGGAGLAEKFGKFIADSPRAQAIFGGMMGLLGGGE